MKERPILFSDPMVRALLSGQKTQTRRVVKPLQVPTQKDDGTWFSVVQKHPRWGFGVGADTEQECAAKLVEFGGCPYGQPGDRLWVRECWAPIGNEDGHPVNKAGELCSLRDAALIYRADAKVGAYGIHELSDGTHFEGRWSPSIFMPRAACRLVLEIVSVRVERLQDISRGDAMAEGCPFPNMMYETDPVGWFADLWCGINGAESWAANPWAWVIEFKAMQP